MGILKLGNSSLWLESIFYLEILKNARASDVFLMLRDFNIYSISSFHSYLKSSMAKMVKCKHILICQIYFLSYFLISTNSGGRNIAKDSKYSIDIYEE